jgi:hypothetical protein
MIEQNTHWTNKVHVITTEMLSSLISELNEFFQNRFVIATQVWSPRQASGKSWVAIVYFKVAPENKQ